MSEPPLGVDELAVLARAQGLQLPAPLLGAIEASLVAAWPALQRLRERPVPLGEGYIEPHDGLAWIVSGGRSGRAASST